MGKKGRLGLYFETTEIRKLILDTAAKQGMSPTAYCTRAIEERLVRDGALGNVSERQAFLSEMVKYRAEKGIIDVSLDDPDEE
jgi:hypothetical protein